MRETQHTPAPWSVFRISNESKILIESNTRELAVVHGADCAEGQANARLINSAPELLVACEQAEIALELLGFPKVSHVLRLAISEARGE